LPKDTPLVIRNLLGRCLERDLRRRLQAIGEARIILDTPVSRPEMVAPVEAPRNRTWMPWTITALLVLALTALAYLHFKPTPSPNVVRFPIVLGEGQQLQVGTNRLLAAISPDATQIAYVANQRLYLRSMADLQQRPLSPTTNGQIAAPAFSPDGKSIAFYWNSDLTIKRVALSGGAPVTVCQTGAAPFGMSWSPEGILFARGKEIFRCNENGGKPETLITAKDGERVTQPQMLPGGKAVLFTVGPEGSVVGGWDTAQVAVQTLKSSERKVLISGGSDGRYVPTGHLIYALGGVLFTQPFDLGSLSVSGSPVSMVEGVVRGSTGVANFSISDNGSLIYIPGPANTFTQGSAVLGLVDRNGNIEALKMPPSTYAFPRVSPDGKHIAYGTDDGKEANIGIFDLGTANAPRPLTFGGANRYPIWANNDRVAFQSERDGDAGIWWTRADGTGTAERLTKPEKGAIHTPDSWSTDGGHFLFTSVLNNAATLWVYSMKDKKATLFADVPGGFAARGVFSRDGHWVAYQAFESGETRIYVQPFPQTGAKHRVPQDGNSHHAVWSPSGTELFFVPGPTRLDSVSFTTQPSPAFGPPTPMPKGAGFETREPAVVRSYDILPNGKQFVGIIAAARAQSADGALAGQQIQVVLNWFEELKQRVPVK
jgi:eukaryotic-like serine/threonine-protein kinase